MTITELGDFIRANPCAWNQLTADQQAVAKAALLPGPNGFTAEQRDLLNKWWLRCTQSQVDAMNASLPSDTRVSPITVDGLMYVGGDLLTDSLNADGMYFPASSILQSLVASYFVYTPPAAPRP